MESIMKKSIFILLSMLFCSFLFSESFTGLYDIHFGQSPAEVKQNIERHGFTESELSELAKGDELIFSKKDTSFYNVKCSELLITVDFDDDKKLNIIQAFFTDSYNDDDKLYSDIESTINIFTDKYNFILLPEQYDNTKSAFVKELFIKNEDKLTSLEVCNNYGLILFQFKVQTSENIQWLKITSWEYVGEDSSHSYILDLYEDFKDAKIDEKKIIEKKKSSYSFMEFFSKADCTVAKLTIVLKDDPEDKSQLILFIENDELYEGILSGSR